MAIDGAPALMRWCEAASPILTLPQGRRFCERLERDCAQSWTILRHRLLINGSGGDAMSLPIVANADRTTPCGFGTDLMERTGLVAIAAALRRPIAFWNHPSEPMRSVYAPHNDLVAAGLTPEATAAAQPFASKEACEHHYAQACDRDGFQPQISHKCDQLGEGHAPGQYVIHPQWEVVNSYWDFAKQGGRPGVLPAERLFARTPLHFISHNAIGAFGPLIAHASIPLALGRGASLSSSPRCITARFLDRVSYDALARATALLSRLQARGRVFALHLRRGDSAMHRECPECVAHDEPDIKSADRIELGSIERMLRGLNRSLTPQDGVFVASDTRGALRAARQLLGGARLSWQRHGELGGARAPAEGAATAVHSTQLKSFTAANKLLADFIAMTIADRLVRVGDSSLSGCAATLGANGNGR